MGLIASWLITGATTLANSLWKVDMPTSCAIWSQQGLCLTQKATPLGGSVEVAFAAPTLAVPHGRKTASDEPMASLQENRG
jgi:hypothetical protein